MAVGWAKERSLKRIKTWLRQVEVVSVKDYVRDTDLNELPIHTAYRVNGVHLYLDILNINEMLASTADEGVTCHRRTLRFLNLHFRAVHRILAEVDAIEVDFHNERLHATFVKPYDDECARVHRAVATAQLIMDVLTEIGEGGDDPIPGAKVRVGLDTGPALAVNNGRRGHREPLFLGDSANRAAKRAGGGTKTGIYLTNTARAKLGLDATENEDSSPLPRPDIERSCTEAKLGVSKDKILEGWRSDLKANPIARFEFSGHTPPLSTLDVELLSPSNSRRQSVVSAYADIDGFTNFVGLRISDGQLAKDVVRVLHVVRSELDAVLKSDFGGLKVRFVGDCVHGLIAEGTAQTADETMTMTTATLASAALHSGFRLAIEMLHAEGYSVAGLGLAVGFDFGPLALTRLGMKGAMVRCAVGRNVLQSEQEQLRCTGSETAIGVNAYNKASEAVREISGNSRKRRNLDYPTAVDELADNLKKNSLTAALSGSEPALLRSAAVAAPPASFPTHNAAPTKPRGFA